MKIVALKIQNFRGLKSAQLSFADHTVVIGPNNCGKSTIIEALALVLGRDRLVRDLTEHDFFGSDPGATDRINIVVTLTEFPGDDPDRSTDWFREERGVPKWLDPATGTLHAEAKTGRKLACQIGVAARFDKDSLDVEFLRYFHDDDVDDVFTAEAIKTVPARLIRELGFFLVPANRTWDRTLSFGSELFRRVVSSIGGQPAVAVLAERARLRQPALPLEKDAGLVAMIAEIESELSGILGRSVEVRLRLTSTDSDGVLDAVIPHYAMETSHQIPARRQGSGLVSLQHILLLLHFGRLRASQNKSFVMAMEEPELHVPPPLQRRLVHRIRSLSTQTVVVTHSPVVASACDPTTIRVLNNSNGTMTAKALVAAPLTRSDPNWKRILYGVKRQDTLAALTHETVLVPEGRIDFDLLTLMMHAEELRRPVAAGAMPRLEFGTIVGVIPTTDANVEGVFQELTRVHPRVLCLIDGDAAGDGYITKLKKLVSPPKRILQLPAGWAIEDIVGWIVEADEAKVLKELSVSIGSTISKATDLTTLMKKETKNSGWKGDVVAYELIINALADNAACLARMRQFLRCVAEACSSLATMPTGWAATSVATTATSVIRFVP